MREEIERLLEELDERECEEILHIIMYNLFLHRRRLYHTEN